MKITLSLIVLLLALGANGATITAASGVRDDVAAAVSAAVDGDVVQIPEGTNTWTTGIYTSKRITIRGVFTVEPWIAVPTTRIIMNMPTTAGSSTPNVPAFGIQGAGHVQGIAFQGVGGSTSASFIYATGHGYRISYCFFRGGTQKIQAVLTQNSTSLPTGLIDDCHLHDARIMINGRGSAGSFQSNCDEWFLPMEWGTTNCVVVEDSRGMKSYGNIVDGNRGARWTVRHCIWTNAQVQAHGVQGQNRGTRGGEIYENLFVQDKNQPNGVNSFDTPLFLRSGTWVIYSNRLAVVNGATFDQQVGLVDIRRGYEPYTISGKTDGDSPWDGNEAIPGASGTHTGGTGTVLEDNTKNWDTNIFKPYYITAAAPTWYIKHVWNLTSGAIGMVDTWTATTINVTNITGGTRQNFQAGDSYLVTGGYWSRDQIGRGKDVSLWTSASPYPDQELDPTYVWGNKKVDGVTEWGLQTHNGNQIAFLIKAGRDWTNAVKPGYTPLAYPHPMRTTPPPAPDGSIVIVSQPSSLTVTQGVAASFAVTVSGTAPITYQWRKNGVNVPGEIASLLEFPATVSTNAGTYSVAISNATSYAISSNAVLTIIVPDTNPPAILTPPQNFRATPGQPGSFSCVATGSVDSVLAYQWRMEGTNLPGGTNDTYVFSSVARTNAGAYAVVVTNAFGSVTSAVATLTIVDSRRNNGIRLRGSRL